MRGRSSERRAGLLNYSTFLASPRRRRWLIRISCHAPDRQYWNRGPTVADEGRPPGRQEPTDRVQANEVLRLPTTQALVVANQLKVGSLILIDVVTAKGIFRFSLTPK